MDRDDLLSVLRGVDAVVDAAVGLASNQKFRRRSELLTAVSCVVAMRVIHDVVLRRGKVHSPTAFVWSLGAVGR